MSYKNDTCRNGLDCATFGQLHPQTTGFKMGEETVPHLFNGAVLPPSGHPPQLQLIVYRENVYP